MKGPTSVSKKVITGLAKPAKLDPANPIRIYNEEWFVEKFERLDELVEEKKALKEDIKNNEKFIRRLKGETSGVKTIYELRKVEYAKKVEKLQIEIDCELLEINIQESQLSRLYIKIF
jgi:uncharacterized protein (UPF0335 family)